MPAKSCRPSRRTSFQRCRAASSCDAWRSCRATHHDAARFLTITGGMKQALHTSLLTFPALGLLLLAQSCTDESRGPGATAPIETVVAATADQVLVGAGNIATCGGEDDLATATRLGAIPRTRWSSG